jgi:acyl-coenzyme A thioesterase PaaI-like protein
MFETRTETTTVKILVGELPREAVDSLGWGVAAAPEAPARLREAGLEFICLGGTWCPDVREWFPPFLALLDAAGVPRERVRIIGLPRDRKLAPWTERFPIDRIPTFVVVRDGKEIGRIVESPRISLAADLDAILAGELGLQDRYAPHSTCFGCGPANPSGLRIRSRVEGDTVVAEWKPEKFHEAFPGMLNGGIIGSLLDCHSNWTAAWHLMRATGADQPPCTVTADYAIKLLRPTPTSGPVRLVARVAASEGPAREDRATVEAELIAGGKVCATCRGTFVAVKPGHPAFHRW